VPYWGAGRNIVSSSTPSFDNNAGTGIDLTGVKPVQHPLIPENQSWMATVMKLWGQVGYNPTRRHWFLKGRWQGKPEYFSQLPTRGDFITCKTEEMAKFLQTEISRDIARGIFNPARYRKARPLHLKSFAEKWLDLQKHISYVTYKGYRSYIRNWILPLLGDEYLGDLSHEKLVSFFNELPLNIKTKKNVFGCLHKILEDARKSGYISQLPAWIEFTGARSIPQRQIQWLDRQSQLRILDEIPERHRPIFEFIFLTGVRPSEARALRKRDIKADHILIAVTFAPEKGGEKLRVVKNRKEEPIPLYESVRELLSRTPGNLTEFVFANPDTGRPYSRNFNRDLWNPSCIKALGYLFSLNNAGRHSFANQLLASGAEMEDVSALLRHSGTQITKQNYGRPHLQVLKKVVDNVQRLK
jgi:integrase